MLCPEYAMGIQDMCGLLTALVLTILEPQGCSRELPLASHSCSFRA